MTDSACLEIGSCRHEHDAEHDETIHDTVTLNQRCFAFIRPRTPLVYKYPVILRTQSHNRDCCWLLSIGIDQAAAARRLTVKQLQYWSGCMGAGRATQIDAKQISDSGM